VSVSGVFSKPLNMQFCKYNLDSYAVSLRYVFGDVPLTGSCMCSDAGSAGRGTSSQVTGALYWAMGTAPANDICQFNIK